MDKNNASGRKSGGVVAAGAVLNDCVLSEAAQIYDVVDRWDSMKRNEKKKWEKFRENEDCFR